MAQSPNTDPKRYGTVTNTYRPNAMAQSPNTYTPNETVQIGDDKQR